MDTVSEMPDGSNFFASLDTALAKAQVARLFGARGWTVRMCTWEDFEVRCPWAELVIDGESPILLHGPVADVQSKAEEILEPLRSACIAYSAECYGEEGNELLQEFKWSPPAGA